ncbi:hypothetical protein RRG08_042387 [Elysia crispata]|uniref:Uncharacterized protein n=1 Tax=Elysia crispata TaxID=231223 RepID=A0AAE1DDM7_9GAST|nr:hypothetical protein RRG08_042387 [Elysia crispata]
MSRQKLHFRFEFDGSGVPDSSRGTSGTVELMWRHNQAVMGLVYLTVQEEPRVQLIFLWRHNQAVMGLVYLTVQEESRTKRKAPCIVSSLLSGEPAWRAVLGETNNGQRSLSRYMVAELFMSLVGADSDDGRNQRHIS